MKAGTRLALYAALLAGIFAGSYAIGSVAIPDHLVQEWKADAQEAGTHDDDHTSREEGDR